MTKRKLDEIRDPNAYIQDESPGADLAERGGLPYPWRTMTVPLRVRMKPMTDKRWKALCCKTDACALPLSAAEWMDICLEFRAELIRVRAAKWKWIKTREAKLSKPRTP